MSKKESADLHALVSSLSKTERSYLKKLFHGNRNGKQKKFFHLYDVVVSGKVPEEKYSPRIKHYLYANILKSLDAYHSESSVEIILRKMLNGVEVLYEKALYDQCRKMIAKGKKIAQKYEKFTLILQFLRFEISLTVSSFDFLSIDEKADKLQNEVNGAIEKIKNISQFLILYSKIFALIVREGIVRSAALRKKYEMVMNVPLLSSEKNAKTNYSKLLFYHIHAVHANALSRSKLHYHYSKQMVTHIEDHPSLFEEEKERYLIGLNNALLALLEMNEFPEVEIYLAKLRSIPKILKKPNPDNLEVRVFARSYIIELWSLLKQGYFERAVSLLNPIKKGIRHFGDKINKSNYAELCYLTAYGFFGTRNFRDAIVWLNKILNNKEAEELSIYESAWMLHLIIYFEMKDFDYLEYRIRSVKHLLRRKKHLFDTKLTLLDFLSGYIREPLKKENEIIKAFIKLRRDLPSSKAKIKSSIEYYFNVDSWIETKISNCSLAEAIVKRKK